MTEYIEDTIEQRQMPRLVIIGGVVLILLLLALLLRDGERPLKPIRPSVTPVELSQTSQASLVTFDELNANPYAFHNQRIRVTGDYTPQTKPDCPDYKGLLIQWALINDTLQLNGYGFESVLNLIPAGTTLTVEGVWRLYEGLAGCGKGADRQLIWYLQVERIVQPNPLTGFGPLVDGDTPVPAGTPPDSAVPTPAAENVTAVPTPTSSTTPTMTATPTVETTPSMTPSPSVTLLPGESTPTPTDLLITDTPDPLISPTATGTGPAPTNTPSSLTTPGTAVSTLPPITTSTPGPSPTPGSGYPGPGTPVPTVDPYP